MWFRKKQEVITSKEFQELERKIIEISTRLDMLETNFRIFSTKFNKKLGRLPTEVKQQEEKKDFYSGMLLEE